MRSLEKPVDARVTINGQVRLAHSVVMRHFVTETVLMDINSGEYFRFDAGSGTLLRALVEGASIENAVDLIAARYPENKDGLRAELVTLYKKLYALKLIR